MAHYEENLANPPLLDGALDGTSHITGLAMLFFYSIHQSTGQGQITFQETEYKAMLYDACGFQKSVWNPWLQRPNFTLKCPTLNNFY